jgi:N6-adenosine-specific RNA methylase IME4
MSKKFSVIVADPPWAFSDRLKMSDVPRGAEANYQVLSLDDIKQLPIVDYTDPDGAILALWVPSSLLQDGLDTMKTWGFTHKQTYVWVKTKKTDNVKKVFFKTAKDIHYDLTNKKPPSKVLKDFVINLYATLGFGMGRLFRQTHEICLIGTSNNKIYQQLTNKSQRSVCFAENLKHSAKPEHLQDSLELMFPKSKKLELFARRLRDGWTCLGNEVCNDEDIRVSLSKL